MTVRTHQTDMLLGVTLRERPRLRSLLIVLAVSAAAAFLYAWDPVSSSGWIACPYHSLTGMYCPGCGTMRALHQLLHGHVLAAARFNLLTILVLPFLGYPFLSSVMMLVRGRALSRVMLPGVLGWVLAAAVILFWVLRNIPVYPLTVLAP